MLGRAAPGAAGTMPDHVAPMQVVAGELPTGAEWVAEFAWPGLRCLAYAQPHRLRLLTAASDRDVTASFPELVAPLTAAAGGGVIVDGTVVALGDGGVPRRRLLQARSATTRPTEAQVLRTPVGFLAGDLLWWDGRSTVELPYRRRRELLARLGLDAAPVVVSPSFPLADIDAVLRAADQHGVEALHVKHLEGPYRPGKRSRTWLRVPTARTRRVLVGGWTPIDPRRPDSVAALLLGVPEDGEDGGAGGSGDDAGGLRYVGRVGLGSNPAHRRLATRLTRIRRQVPPFAGDLPARVERDGQWVDPVVAGLVEFVGWTREGRLRLPLWRGEVEGGAPPAPWAEPPQQARARRAATEAAVDEAATSTARVAAPATGTAGAVGAAAEPPQTGTRSLEQHFVYNSLNTIASLVRTDPARARELLLGFADLARAADQPAGATVRLGRELDAVESYLRIEQARFGRRLGIDVAVDPALHALAVPATAVLSAVRGAVQQRIEPRPEGGTVRVRVADDAGGQAVLVDDDTGEEPVRIPLG